MGTGAQVGKRFVAGEVMLCLFFWLRVQGPPTHRLTSVFGELGPATITGWTASLYRDTHQCNGRYGIVALR